MARSRKTPPSSPSLEKRTEFSHQINLDQQKYSRYVCDSRAIPQEIDGLKPVQRRVIWAMYNSTARNTHTKTVKVAGLAMAYHPHGDKSIQDALSAMAQNFPFANNYSLVDGEGTFGDILDPQAIASPRYTEVRLSQFAKDLGFFESLPDIDFVHNYDETEQEPVFFVGKIPVVLLNNTIGIATGFRCNIPGHKLDDIIKSMVSYLKKKKALPVDPWYRDYVGPLTTAPNLKGETVLSTGFGFEVREGSIFLVAAPQNWNRQKVIDYLELIIADKATPLRDYLDQSTDKFEIELIPKRGEKLTVSAMEQLFDKKNNETLAWNVITTDGRLENHNAPSIIRRFCEFRKKHLIRRFTRLSALEKEKIQKNTELIRFIKEEWNLKVTKIKSKSDFENKLQDAKFVFYEWLASIPVYRMTLEEVKKCNEAIVEAREMYKYYQKLIKEDKALTGFIIDELSELQDKYGEKAN
jgi:DNA gyrase subunit A